MKDTDSFTKKLLYRQKTNPGYTIVLEGDYSLDSEIHNLSTEITQCISLWGISWIYPGTESVLTARVRLNVFLFKKNDENYQHYEGNAEVWKDSGWIALETLYPHADNDSFTKAENALIDMVESFYTGKEIESQSPDEKKEEKENEAEDPIDDKNVIVFKNKD